MFTVNTQSTFLCYKYAAKQMVKQGRGGRIIGASSLAGKTGVCGTKKKNVMFIARLIYIVIMSKTLKGWPMLTAYSLSKFAIRGLTQNAGLLLINL